MGVFLIGDYILKALLMSQRNNNKHLENLAQKVTLVTATQEEITS